MHSTSQLPRTPTAGPPRRRNAVAVVALLALVGAACSSGTKHVASVAHHTTAPAATVTVTVPPPPPTYPLTGIRATDASRLHRPVLVVKVDNAQLARPQAGLDSADVVFEEVVEGGITRLLAAYQSHDAPLVGPVRSVRPIDPQIVTPLHGLFAYSGGAPKFQALIRHAPVLDVGYDADPGAYYRDRSRVAPHNLMSSTGALYRLASGQAAPPSLFHYLVTGQSFGGPGIAPLNGMQVVMSTRTTVDWGWNPALHLWMRGMNGTAYVNPGGAQLGVPNVILQFASYRNTGDVDVAREPVPVADIIGGGEAWVLSGGKLVKGRWAKPNADMVTGFTDATGAPIELAPGPTWIEIVPGGSPTIPR
ncbi:MAG: DUF3048 domain-containing protein [Actinobacteria bacterium]|nr:MAG: DUF3048 domain-containing protein [Actinomycetota bacterium]